MSGRSHFVDGHNRVHPHHEAARFTRQAHFILPLKESTVEAVAEQVTVLRRRGPTTDAAVAALREPE